MKKQEIALPKTTATEVANRLSKGMGKPLAKRLAEHTAKTLGTIGATDVNAEVASFKHITKQVRFWSEVTAILSK